MRIPSKIMNYTQFVEYLYSLNRTQKGKKRFESSSIAEAIDRALGSPSKTLPIVHIAGTNGKGSCAHKIGEAFSLAGLKTGIFTSPHIEDIRERIKINHEMISEEDFASYGSLVLKTLESNNAHFFEILTCVALKYFYDKKVDIAVIETGVGGRYDTTNFLTPVLSIITSISFDHSDLLGKTLEEIAFQKAGIIKPSIPVVLGPSAQKPIIIEEARKKEAPIILNSAYNASTFDEENSMVSKEALSFLSKTFPSLQNFIEEALKKRPDCRMQSLSLEGLPKIILDVAHNVDGFRRLFKDVKKLHPGQKIYCILGISKDKEIPECIEEISSHAFHVYLPTFSNDRLISSKALEKAFHHLGYFQVSIEKDIRKILQEIATSCKDPHIVLISGSFYIMKECREVIFSSPSRLDP